MPVSTPPEDRFAIQDLLARYAWTPDFRYASTGALPGKDGPCFGLEPGP